MNLEVTNENYAATIVTLTHNRKHVGADRLTCWNVQGCNVITDLSATVGERRVFFPLECAINSKILHEYNLYSSGDMNKDTSVKGYFDKKGRVRAVRLRGERSEGFTLPIECLAVLGLNPNDFKDGDTFNDVNDVHVAWKYVPPRRTESSKTNQNKVSKKAKSIIVPDQFRHHEDTSQLKRNAHRISEDDVVSVTYKLHGTSGISANILTYRPLSFIEKVKKRLGLRIKDEQVYKNIYSSRRVIKNDREDSGPGYYSSNIWGAANDDIKDLIPKGVTLYYEIVGYLPSGEAIQKGYDYGCEFGKHDIYVYRGTHTDSNGVVTEMSTLQLMAFCESRGIKHVPLLEYGVVSKIVGFSEDEVGTRLLQYLDNTYLERKCYMCKNDVPCEGVVVRREKVAPQYWEAYKHKSFSFYERETALLDAGEADIESVESV